MALFSSKRLGNVLDFFLFNHIIPIKIGKIKRMDQGFLFYKFIDLLFAILIIAIVCSIAIPQLIESKKKAMLVHAYGCKSNVFQVHVYHSLTGLWPTDDAQIEKVVQMPRLNEESNPAFVGSVHIDHAAIHVTFSDKLDGQILTLRPAFLKDDPLGPVIWIAGDMSNRPEWNVVGENKTDIDPILINQFLR